MYKKQNEIYKQKLFTLAANCPPVCRVWARDLLSASGNNDYTQTNLDIKAALKKSDMGTTHKLNEVIENILTCYISRELLHEWPWYYAQRVLDAEPFAAK